MKEHFDGQQGRGWDKRPDRAEPGCDVSGYNRQGTTNTT